jgi:alkylation response protein AidB-like acyl-CoA dehydrogenase
MRFELTPEQRAWHDEVAAFLAAHMPPALVAELDTGDTEGRGPYARAFLRTLGARGWWGIGWPREYGGLARSAVDQYLFIEEMEWAFAPSLHLTVTSVAPTIMRVGSEAMKRDWLPRIVRGEVDFAIGYSEPEAGTDLASLHTRAVPDGDDFIVNGQKIWNTGASHATHQWLACRTDPAAPKHQGISLLIVPMDTPGISVQSMDTWGGFPTHQVFFDNVRVPRTHLVGEPHRGWQYMTMALGFERVAMGSVGQARRLFEDLVAYCRRTRFDGALIFERSGVRRRLAALATDLEIGRLLGWLNATTIDQGGAPVKEASMVKVFNSELRQRVCAVGLEVLDMHGQITPNPGAAEIFRRRLQRMYRAAPVWRFGGGTNEVQRNIIAQTGLGLPRG